MGVARPAMAMDKSFLRWIKGLLMKGLRIQMPMIMPPMRGVTAACYTNKPSEAQEPPV
jgi:hypothetical protein